MSPALWLYSLLHGSLGRVGLRELSVGRGYKSSTTVRTVSAVTKSDVLCLCTRIKSKLSAILVKCLATFALDSLNLLCLAYQTCCGAVQRGFYFRAWNVAK